MNRLRVAAALVGLAKKVAAGNDTFDQNDLSWLKSNGFTVKGDIAEKKAGDAVLRCSLFGGECVALLRGAKTADADLGDRRLRRLSISESASGESCAKAFAALKKGYAATLDKELKTCADSLAELDKRVDEAVKVRDAAKESFAAAKKIVDGYSALLAKF